MDQPENEFERLARERQDRGLLREFSAFLWENKEWWLIPIGLVLLLVSVALLLGGTGVAPFLYTLF